MEKIPYAEFKAMVMNPDTPSETIARYVTVDAAESGPFDPVIVPDPAKVDMTTEAEFDVENAIKWGNATERTRRQIRFRRRIAFGSNLPVLVSEGDSWFQFPILIQDVVDHLDADHLIWSLDAAGDTADNMVNRRPEYMAALVKQKANGVAGFIFSGAGNDVIGENLLGEPVLEALIRQHRPGKDAAWHVDSARLARIMRRLDSDYRKVIKTIRSDKDFANLPIFVHGYDYAIPGGYPGDKRNPLWAKQDKWLGAPMKRKGIVDPTLQGGIIRHLIDALYAMLSGVAGKSRETRVWVVDVRGTLKRNEWADEIHATDAGFAKVAKKFRTVIANGLREERA